MRIPFFPLGTVLFPGAPLVLHVFEERYRELLRTCLAEDRRFGVVLISRGSEVGGGEERERIGTIASIERVHPLGDGRSLLEARGTERIEVRAWADDDPFPRGEYEPFPSPSSDVPPGRIAEATDALRRARALAMQLYANATPLPELPDVSPEALGWWLCEQAPLSVYDRQRLLESPTLGARLEMLLGALDELTTTIAWLRDRD